MPGTPVERPRVLILIKGLGIGGAERLISEGARVWDRDAFDYRVAYLLPHKDQLAGELVSMGVVVVHHLGGARPRLGLATICRLRRLLAEWRPDIVHAHLPSAGILARLLTRAPVVYTEHNLADSYRTPTRQVNRLTYGRNRVVIAVSEAVAASLAGYPGPDPRVVPNGVSMEVGAEEIAAARRELALEDHQALVVHVGNIRPHKGHDTLIQAAAIVARTHPHIRFVSIGAEKREGDLERVISQAAEAGVSESLRFLGRRADARAFIAAADALVNPADVEGLPVAILEAMALGIPVVATAVGGVPSLVRDGETGRLTPAGDPAALAAGIIEVIESPQAGSWAREGATLVRARHGIEGMIEAYEDIYREILGE